MAIFEALRLKSGLTLKNRIAKAAMEENMAEANQLPGNALLALYQKWAQGGVSLIITGNVMIDKLAMTGPGGVVLEDESALDAFAAWSKCAKENDTKVVMQINHPGRQVFKSMGGKVISPSDVALNMGKHSGLFSQPTPMSQDDIDDTISRFVTTAALAQKAGFDGVQIHAAHGYLISQFLSPLTNKRDDQWGGAIENRARILFSVIAAVKARCGSAFSMSVKLNSADFQRGGFDLEDAEAVIKQLNEYELDFIELSGGSYEAPAMQGKGGDARTLAREAYFLEFAKQLSEASTSPIMLTGGISRLEVAKNALEQGISIVGMASALAYTPSLVNQWQAGSNIDGFIPRVGWKDKTLSGLANMALVKRQLRRLGDNKAPKKNASALYTLVIDQIRKAKLTKRYKEQFIKTDLD